GNSGLGMKGFHRKYDDPTGNVIKSRDDNSRTTSGEPADSRATIYTYYTTGDAKNLVKDIRKPGGDCSTTVAAGRKLCTSYTYDGAGRVTSVTNGNAILTTYRYDKMDRVTGVFFDGSTSCAFDSSDCHSYLYD